jgi:hypothetical protein
MRLNASHSLAKQQSSASESDEVVTAAPAAQWIRRRFGREDSDTCVFENN